MTSNNTAAKTATITPITAEFTPSTVTIDGITYPATYTVEESGVIRIMVTASSDPVELYRISINPCEAAYPAALVAAKPCPRSIKAAPTKATTPAAKSAATVSPAIPAATPAKATKAATPAKATKAATPAKATKAAAPAKATKAATPAKAAAKSTATVSPAAPAAPVDTPAAPADKPIDPAKLAHGPVPEKTFAGTAITGKGWRIVFDADANRTRVYLTSGDAWTADAKKAIEAAGFYWAPSSGAWQKKLTFRAHRAALELAKALEKLSSK